MIGGELAPQVPGQEILDPIRPGSIGQIGVVTAGPCCKPLRVLEAVDYKGIAWGSAIWAHIRSPDSMPNMHRFFYILVIAVTRNEQYLNSTPPGKLHVLIRRA